MINVYDLLCKSSATERGLHAALNYGRCPYKAQLDKAIMAAQTEGKPLPEEGSAVGIIGHKLLEEHHSLLPPSVPRTIAAEETVVQSYLDEAHRCSDEYMRRFPHDFWGRVIGTEQSLAHGRWTGRLDLVTEMEEKHTTNIKAQLGYELQPGLYVIDHKFYSKKPSEPQHDFELQALVYSMLAEKCLVSTLFPAPFRGVIFNVIVKHKKMTADSFVSVLFPKPEQKDYDMLEAYMNAQDKMPTDYKNLANCYVGFSVCPHKTTGLCDRRNG